MREYWEPEDLVGAWTLVDDDWRLVANKSGPLGSGSRSFLKVFEQEARFPGSPEEVPAAAVTYVAHQLGVDAEELADYDWAGRSIKYHRAQIREALGFREPTRGDEAKLTAWFAEEVAPTETTDDALKDAALAHCRAEGIEPPGRLERVVAAHAPRPRRRCAPAPSPVWLRWWSGWSGWAGARKTPTTATGACCSPRSRPTRPG